MSIYTDAPARSPAARDLKKRAQRHPAKALYLTWLTILESYSDAKHLNMSVAYRNSAIRITGFDSNGRPELSYGGNFTVRENGHFSLKWLTRPSERRLVGEATFLDWSHFRGDYQWYFSPSFERASYWDGRSLCDWQDPIHYISEKVMGAHGYIKNNIDLKLVPDTGPGGWRIAPASFSPTNKNYGRIITEADFVRYEELRQRRYRLLERQWRIHRGEIDVRGRRLPTPEEKEVRLDQEAACLMAHFDVSQPARTVPLRKTPKEEGLWPLSGSR